MTPKNTAEPEENPLGVLDEAASLDTAGIGILGRTAQVSVTLPKDEDDDLTDDGVVDGEVSEAELLDDLPVITGVIEEVPHDEPLDAIVIEVAELEEPAEDQREAEAEAEAEAKAAAEAEAKAEAKAAAEAAKLEVAKKAAAREVAAREAEEAAAAAQAEEAAAAEAAAAAEVAKAEEEAAAQFLARAHAEVKTDKPAPASAVRAAAEKEISIVSTPQQRSAVSKPTRATSRDEVALTSKRLGELGESVRESADLLTADRLLDPHQLVKPEPEGAWSHFLYAVSGRRINIGDGKRARERKALSARIAAPIAGGARFVPVLSRKGGVGKTTITALLGMALADAREDRVIAVDANPDRGTLAERIVRPSHSKSVRDLVRIHDDVKGYHDISAIVARDATRLDVLSSDPDPRIAEAFSGNDYRDVAEVAAHFYSLVLTDTGTGIVHSVMGATLDLADQIVIVSGLSVDEARLASETLTWLETNGYTEQARNAIVVLNQSTPGAPLVRLNELQNHFATRVRSVVRVPYDPQIAGGGTIVFANLRPETRVAARELAALLVEGLRTKAA